jgi:SP family galactose:H+ symporter-like MFS transporter
VAPTIILAIQLVAVEQVIPKSRPFSGWISEHSTQISGPALIAKPTINISTFIAIGLVDRWGRKPTLILGFIVMAAGMGVLGSMMHIGICSVVLA